MTIELKPEFGVPITPEDPYVDLRERAQAACATVDELISHGFEIPQEQPSDKLNAAVLAKEYAADPTNTSKAVTHARASQLTPAALSHIRTYLDTFGHAVVEHAVELRHLVTNRLLEESQNPDPRIRIRALELLGKISDVGLFTDKQEITITHQTTDELKDKLRQKLQKLRRMSNSEATAPVDMADGVIDVDAELGITPKTAPDDEKPDEVVQKLDSTNPDTGDTPPVDVFTPE